MLSADCTNCPQSYPAKGDEIFLIFRTILAISGHGCPDKPDLRLDGECRAVASTSTAAPEYIENPSTEAG